MQDGGVCFVTFFLPDMSRRNTVRSSRTQTNSYTGQLVYKELFSYVLQALKSINFNLKKKEVNFNEFENEAE